MTNAIEIAWVLTLLLASCRAAGVALVAPPMGLQVVPIRLRVLMALVLGLAVAGRLASPAPLPTDGWALAIQAALELLLGAVIGLSARLLLTGVQWGAEHMAQQIGVGIADALQPGELDAGGSFRRLFTLLAVVAFLLVGGAESLCSALLRTFDAVPLGGAISTTELLPLTVRLLAGSVLLALKVAAPIVTAMLLATIVLAVVQRTMPSCNLLTVGLPLRSILGLVVLAAGVLVLPGLVENAWNTAQNAFGSIIK